MGVLYVQVLGGRIDLPVPPDWPDGTPVAVYPDPLPTERIGIDEKDWRDDEAALEDWDRWIKTLEPLDYTAEEQGADADFRARMKAFNIEAVRRQMANHGGS